MRAIAVLVFLLFASQSNAEQVSVCNGRQYKMPDGIAVPCSHTWALHAKCTSGEMVHDWVIDGNKPGDHYIRPFADVPITVIGYEMVAISRADTIWFMIGSGHQPDGFLWMGAGETRSRWMMAPGLGHPWPSKQDAAANWKPGYEEVIDVHGSCESPWYRRAFNWIRGRQQDFTMMVTVYYVALPERSHDKLTSTER